MLRAAVVARRATVVLVTDQSLEKRIELAQSRCDGRGRVVLACAELVSPWRRTTLVHPAAVHIGHATYPKSLLRYSHSAYGVMVASCSSFTGPAIIPSLRGASLPRLEVITHELVHGWKRFGIGLWNNLNQDSSFLPLYPLAGLISDSPDKPPVYYDILVTLAAECELFIATPEGPVECHVNWVLLSQQIPLSSDNDRKPWGKRYAVPGVAPGPFAVVPHGKARYLVTAAGTLVKLVGAGGKPLATAETVYDQSRVLAVVHDADENKRYAFTATHYFEVAEPLVLKPHAVKAFGTSSGAAGLECAFHCGRAVRGLPPAAFPAAK